MSAGHAHHDAVAADVLIKLRQIAVQALVFGFQGFLRVTYGRERRRVLNTVELEAALAQAQILHLMIDSADEIFLDMADPCLKRMPAAEPPAQLGDRIICGHDPPSALLHARQVTVEIAPFLAFDGDDLARVFDAGDPAFGDPPKVKPVDVPVPEFHQDLRLAPGRYLSVGF